MKALLMISFVFGILSNHPAKASEDVSEAHTNAIQMCNVMSIEVDHQKCYILVQNAKLSENAVAFCKKAPYLDHLDCLGIAANATFQDEALQLCEKAPYAFEMDCLESIKNKMYQASELKHCATVAADEIAFCLADAGQKVIRSTTPTGRPLPPPRRPQSPAALPPPVRLPTRPVPPSYPPYQRPRVSTPPASTPVDYCEVHNTSSFLARVPKLEFILRAQLFAKENNSCVVASFYKVRSSRMLISPNGKVLKENLTEEGATQAKDDYHFERCKVLICQ